MIRRVRGTLMRREMDAVEVMTAGGVGYEIEIPISVFEKLPRVNAEVELLTWLVVREDDQLLFGFLQEAERDLFGRLLGASGVVDVDLDCEEDHRNFRIDLGSDESVETAFGAMHERSEFSRGGTPAAEIDGLDHGPSMLRALRPAECQPPGHG